MSAKNYGFFDVLLKKIDARSSIESDLSKCLKVMSSLMGFPIFWQDIHDSHCININNFEKYEKSLGVKLYSVSLISFNELKKTLHPVLLQINNNNNLFVFVKIKFNHIVLFDPIKNKYKYHRKNNKDVITKAWQCCPTRFPLSSNYCDLLKSILTFFKKDVLFSISMGALVSVLALLTCMISGYVFSHIHEVGQSGHIATLISFVFLLMCTALFSYANELHLKCLNFKATLFILPSLWSHIFNLPIHVVKKISSGDLVQRIVDYEASVSVIVKASLSVLFSALTLVFILVYMTYCDRWLAFFYLCICVVFFCIRMFFFPVSLKYTSAQMADQGKISSFLNEILLQIHKIRSSNVEGEVFVSWLKKLINFKINSEKSIKIEIISSLVESVVPTALLLSMYSVLYFSSSSVNAFSLLQFIICAGQFSNAIEKISSDVSSIIHFSPGFKRLDLIMNAKVEAHLGDVVDIEMSGDINFSHVDFKDPESGHSLLNDISFNIKPGQFVAFVGRSGAGKSTILKLLLGLHSPCSGEIKINGFNINNFNINQIRKQFGVVLQTTNLLPGTLFSNISANTNLTLDEVWQLARCVGLDEEINKMPMKMYTYISDNAGESISGGQKQKILIARALASKPKILLLDEATSALDNKSQDNIHRYLKTLNITRIVIAHRMSTVAEADMIYVLDKGRVVDSGLCNQLRLF